jgi:hypothetical protein
VRLRTAAGASDHGHAAVIADLLRSCHVYARTATVRHKDTCTESKKRELCACTHVYGGPSVRV